MALGVTRSLPAAGECYPFHDGPPARDRLLVRREHARRDAEHAEEARIRDVVLAVLRAHLRPGERAWLIGSLAWGGFGARSDVDLVVALVDERRAMELELRLTKSAGAPVDLLRLEHLPAAFRRRVQQQGLAVP